MAKGWFDFILPPPPYIFVKGTFIFCKLPQIINRCFEYAAQTKPPAGSVLGSEAGGRDMILPVQSPNSASRRCHRRTKKLPPPMTQTQKTARPRSNMLRGLLSLFMDNGSIFSGVLRRLFFVLSLCGDHDDTHCYRVAFLIGSFVKRSAHVVDFCSLFPEQFIAIPSPA